MSFKGTEDNLDNLDINYILNTRSISDKLICTDGFKAPITQGYKRLFFNLYGHSYPRCHWITKTQ